MNKQSIPAGGQQSMTGKQRILAGLGLSAVNRGAWSGKEWHAGADAPLIASINPATGEVIAQVRTAGAADYERVAASATAAFAA